MVGAGTAVGALLAFGIGPLAAAPAAHADFDEALDQVFLPFMDPGTNVFDADALVSPSPSPPPLDDCRPTWTSGHRVNPTSKIIQKILAGLRAGI